ncbi:MAG: hypothetical protein AAGF12_29145 [Myxococcota bacterium]
MNSLGLRWFFLVLLASICSMSGPEGPAGEETSPKDGLIGDAPPRYVAPSLTAHIRYDHPPSPVGWGSFDLSAHPASHEFRVDLVFGAAARQKQWNRCRAVALDVDGESFKVATHYSGIGMSRGIYDAVRAELTIVHVRALAAADRVTARICNEEVILPVAELSKLDEFIREFEEEASYDGPPPPKPPPLLDAMSHPMFDEELDTRPIPS